jgi:hypothetical protein
MATEPFENQTYSIHPKAGLVRVSNGGFWPVPTI